MDAQGNEAAPPMVGNAVGPAAPMARPVIANLAAPVVAAPMVAPPAGANIANVAVQLAAPSLAPGAGPNIVNLMAPLAVPVVALPALPNMVANLGGGLVPPGGGFDIPVGLLGSPPRRGNINYEIHAWINEE